MTLPFSFPSTDQVVRKGYRTQFYERSIVKEQVLVEAVRNGIAPGIVHRVTGEVHFLFPVSDLFHSIKAGRGICIDEVEPLGSIFVQQLMSQGKVEIEVKCEGLPGKVAAKAACYFGQGMTGKYFILFIDG